MKRWIILIFISLAIIITVLSLTVIKEKIKAVFYIEHMESDERIGHMYIDKIISGLKIRPGDSIADIGAGSGLFSRKFASLVTSSGKVYSVDINKDLLKHIDDVNKKLGINNIKTILAGENDPKLPEPVDLIFICDTLHYIDGQEKYVSAMAGYLKSKGRLAVISFKNNFPPMSNKFNENDLAGWMKKAGLELINSYDFIQGQFLVMYQKK
jgi:arsenite methyltransferase